MRLAGVVFFGCPALTGAFAPAPLALGAGFGLGWRFFAGLDRIVRVAVVIACFGVGLWLAVALSLFISGRVVVFAPVLGFL